MVKENKRELGPLGSGRRRVSEEDLHEQNLANNDMTSESVLSLSLSLSVIGMEGNPGHASATVVAVLYSSF